MSASNRNIALPKRPKNITSNWRNVTTIAIILPLVLFQFYLGITLIKSGNISTGSTLETLTRSPVVSKYIDAYNICCGETLIKKSKVECYQEDDDWFVRLMNKFPVVSAGNATLYWAHMRKAGGTSFGTSIESHTFNNTKKPGATFTKGFTHTVKVHLWAGSKDCVDHEYANETLFVTIFRNPVDRYVSEYFYRNIGDKLISLSTKEKVLEWHNRSKNALHIKMNEAMNNFIENWQTRWYTNPYHCDDLNRPPPHDSHPNYSYWRSGQQNDPRMFMTREDLDDAKKVVDKFDIVGVAPFFEGEHSILPWLELAGSNEPTEISTNILNVNTKKSSDVVSDLKTNITVNLYEQIKYDLELFQFASELSKRRADISRCVKENAVKN
jgi:hypothetical protein